MPFAELGGQPLFLVMEIAVRHATNDDVDELIRIAELMYAAMGITTNDAWRVECQAELKARLGDDLVGAIVDRPGEPGRAACSAIGLITRRIAGPDNMSGRFGYIQWVATEPEWRGRGFATAVVGALLEWFDAQQVVSVELHATPSGEPVYRALGFENSENPGLRRRRP